MSKQWIIFDVMGVIFEVGDDTNDLSEEERITLRQEIEQGFVTEKGFRSAVRGIVGREGRFHSG